MSKIIAIFNIIIYTGKRNSLLKSNNAQHKEFELYKCALTKIYNILYNVVVYRAKS